MSQFFINKGMNIKRWNQLNRKQSNQVFQWKRTTFHERTLSKSSIFSIASGSNQRTAVSLIRISGDQSLHALKRLTRNEKNPMERKATLRKIFDPISGEQLDFALTLFFKSPNSFTGEDVVELHLHGGKAVVNGVLNALSKIGGLSHAKPGEFTRRAFENNKIDLTEVEGLADLINAETEAQRRQALRQLSGEMSRLYQGWKESLIHCLAHFEAFIDFGDDEHISEEVTKKVQLKVSELKEEITLHLNDNRRGERLREGTQIAIVGPPNAGKSSLLNLLARRDAAIVSEIPGTTRDIIDITLNFGGYPVVFSDTAGIRPSEDVIELEGIKRAKERFSASDLKICMLEAKQNNFDEIGRIIDDKTILIINKIDLLESKHDLLKFSKLFPHNSKYFISVKNGEGIVELLRGLENRVKEWFGAENGGEGSLITRARHRELLEECLHSLSSFQKGSKDTVLAAEELRSALKSICRIIGSVDIEQVLDVVFSDFCIGK